MRAITSSLLGLLIASPMQAGDPPRQPTPTPAKVYYSAPCHESPAPAAPCWRPGRVWMSANRPIFFEDKFRFEPRIRDIRFAPMSSTLPGTGLGAPDTMTVIPSHRDGYFRLFHFR